MSILPKVTKNHLIPLRPSRINFQSPGARINLQNSPKNIQNNISNNLISDSSIENIKKKIQANSGLQNPIFTLDFKLEEVIKDYKKFFVKRLENSIINNNKQVFNARHSSVKDLQNLVENTTLEIQMKNLHQHIKNYKKLIIKKGNKNNTHEATDVF